jgi:hypothetical protein
VAVPIILSVDIFEKYVIIYSVCDCPEADALAGGDPAQGAEGFSFKDALQKMQKKETL